jgi:hypothetical protein
VVLHGIAREVGEVAKSELVARLWRSRVIQDLCWHKILFSVGEAPAIEPTTGELLRRVGQAVMPISGRVIWPDFMVNMPVIV